MKKKICICILLILCTLLLASWHALVLDYPIVAVCKYIGTVFTIMYTSKIVFELLHLPKIKHHIGKSICMLITACIALCYVFLTIDTFLFHALTWFPGILRYALFNAYGILYLLFVFPALLWYLGSEDK